MQKTADEMRISDWSSYVCSSDLIATDYAIHMGIRSGASIIMCSPCCHKQIRLQIQSPALLKPMLQYGLHLGQQAEMVTDSLRALFLEAGGYEIGRAPCRESVCKYGSISV